LITMGAFGILGWIAHLVLSLISYALTSEFSDDY
jgi:hypothetical protein